MFKTESMSSKPSVDFVDAAKRGDTEMTTALIAAGSVDTNAADNDGSTALMWAAGNGHAETVAALAGVHGLNSYVVTSADVEIDYGVADVTVPAGSSAMDFARLTHHDAAVDALKPLFSKPLKSAATTSRK